MIDPYTAYEGTLPLLISVPHDGSHVPPDIQDRMTAIGRSLPDTDWHVAELYDFARDVGAAMQIANYSRYVIDLNRPTTDEAMYPGQLATGLCPLQTFSGEAIYKDGGVTAEDRAARISAYWQPYHLRIADTLAAMRAQHGHALLWDAHSIPSVVPHLFDGELPELNIGTNDGRSCAAPLQAAVEQVAKRGSYSCVVNARFKGGFITRHYGRPADNVHAIQLEIAQRAYINEASGAFDAARAEPLRVLLRQMLEAYLAAPRGRRVKLPGNTRPLH